MKIYVVLIAFISVMYGGTYDDNYNVLNQNSSEKNYDVLMNGDFDEIVRFSEISFTDGKKNNNSDKSIEDITKITTKYINDKRDILVSIIGYTNIDKENENEKISDSKNYANIIADKLNKKGLDKNLMIVEYRGGKDNLYTNETSYSKDLSNRVMVAIYVLSLKDSDKDGVFDITDECPETPLDRVVDDKGCQLDSDKDGVLDYKDECPNTPQGFTVNSVGCPTKKDLMLNFDTASWKILESSNQIIAEFVEFLKQNPAYNIKIIGHTDSVGKDKANLILSDKRAESLKSAFIDQGIDGTKITTQGLGESSPVASNDTKDGRYKNRRTVIELIELIK